MAKHAFGVFGAAPAEQGYRYECLDDHSLALQTRRCVRDYRGAAVVEAFAVMPDSEGRPASVLAACRTPEGARAWARREDLDLIASLDGEELCGRPVSLASDGSMDLRG